MNEHSICLTCDGTGKWESTTEDSPTELVDLGECPDCPMTNGRPNDHIHHRQHRTVRSCP